MRITNLHLVVSFLFLSGVGFFAYQFLLRNQIPPFGWSTSPLPAGPTAEEVEAARRQRFEKEQLNKARGLASDALKSALSAIQLAEAEGRDASGARQAYDSANTLFSRAAKVMDYNDVRVAAQQAEQLADNAQGRQVNRYVIKRGDNLWNISKRPEVYGRGAGWVKIWRANEKKIPDFDQVVSGQEIVIPR